MTLDVIKSLYKAGLPEGNIFDFTANKLLKFETKWKAETKKKEILDKYKNFGKEKEMEEKAILDKLNKSALSARSQSAKKDKEEKSVKGKGDKAKGKDDKGKSKDKKPDTSKSKDKKKK